MTFRESTIKYIKELIKAKTINEIIAKELREAVIKKLEAESAVEYAASIVTYNVERIARLQRRLKEHEGEE
jgi:tRNA(Phe) wybutosine-synthesizing methylase Tyw3